MKKFAITLMACLAVSPFAHAATTALAESLLEYEAITTALGTNPTFQAVISPTQFIVDIQRISSDVNSIGQVEYEIVTRDLTVITGDCGCDDSDNHHHHRHHRRNRDRNNNSHLYQAVLNVAANPGIGPNIVTVVSITPSVCFIDSHNHN